MHVFLNELIVISLETIKHPILSSGSIKAVEQVVHEPAPKRQCDVLDELNKEVGETNSLYMAKFQIMHGRAPMFIWSPIPEEYEESGENDFEYDKH